MSIFSDAANQQLWKWPLDVFSVHLNVELLVHGSMSSFIFFLVFVITYHIADLCVSAAAQ